MHPMATVSRPPHSLFAKPRANPTLEAIEYLRAALQESGGPASRNQLLERLATWGHSTTRQSLNATLEFLEADGNVAEGSKGIIWIPTASRELQEIVRTGERP